MPTRVFHDDFASGTLAQWTQAPSGRDLNDVVSIAADGGGPHSGSNFMSANWEGSDFTTAWIDDWDYTDEFLIRMWWRIDADVDDASGAKVMRLGWRNEVQGAPDDYAATFQRDIGGGGQWQTHTYWTIANQCCTPNIWSNLMNYQDRQWHKIEIYIKHDSTPNAGDGVLKVWFDGQMVNGYPFTGNTWNGTKRWTPLILPSNWSMNAGWEHDLVNHFYVDDVEIFSDATTGETAVGSLDDATVQVEANGEPVITSPASVSHRIGDPFTHQISATNSPTSFGATGLPTGGSINTGNGLISFDGTTPQGVYSVGTSATNASGTGNQTLTVTVQKLPKTRGRGRGRGRKKP